MFPTIKQCRELSDADRTVLESLDYDLRVALIRARGERTDTALNKAIVTVVLSVAADAAVLSSPDDKPSTLADFLETAKLAFEWSAAKRSKFQPVNS